MLRKVIFTLDLGDSAYILGECLTHFSSLFHFYAHRKCQKSKGFLTFPGSLDETPGSDGLIKPSP